MFVKGRRNPGRASAFGLGEGAPPDQTGARGSSARDTTSEKRKKPPRESSAQPFLPAFAFFFSFFCAAVSFGLLSFFGLNCPLAMCTSR